MDNLWLIYGMLVDGISTPLKKIRVRQLRWWNSQLNGKKQVPNHQPVSKKRIVLTKKTHDLYRLYLNTPFKNWVLCKTGKRNQFSWFVCLWSVSMVQNISISRLRCHQDSESQWLSTPWFMHHVNWLLTAGCGLLVEGTWMYLGGQLPLYQDILQSHTCISYVLSYK